jgi:hypothetical protein
MSNEAEMTDRQHEDKQRREFVWGILLTWAPFLFFVAPALVAVASGRASGVGIAMNGLFGFLAITLTLEVAGIFLLARSFSREHPGRALISGLSFFCSAVMFAICGVALWLFFPRLHA